MVAVDLQQQRVRLSLSATENPRLWAFLKALRPGDRLSGTVAAIERFGVFVDLDDGPDHPVFPGVGFITLPELSWVRFEDPTEVVSVGQHITCEVIVFDTHNGEARLSLRATQPDPFQQFARRFRVGHVLHGQISKLVPFGAFVCMDDGVEGLVHLSELAASPVDTPEEAVEVGDPVTVIVTDIDTQRRRAFPIAATSPAVDRRPRSFVPASEVEFAAAHPHGQVTPHIAAEDQHRPVGVLGIADGDHSNEWCQLNAALAAPARRRLAQTQEDPVPAPPHRRPPRQDRLNHRTLVDEGEL
ncbi:S1 RNA-binding domain-containing protein [Actinomadura welshii]|uniref:S1 RNA-binding domain-containing protein n=1 Tax=Actinomadura welshii TaxID=3103817 RepID=UPI00041C2092